MKKIITSFLMLITALSTQARLMQGWTNQQLFDKSDLVVIATPSANSDTQERIGLPGYTALQVIGIETGFTISATMKGDKTQQKIVLHHYRAVPDGGPVINGPNLLSFTPGDQRNWLLYLVREDDGRYAPTVGQTDPGFYGVNVISGYSPAEKPAAQSEAPIKQQLNTTPAAPLSYRDAESGITFLVESDRHHVVAVDKDGKTLWNRQPATDGMLPPYSEKSPKLNPTIAWIGASTVPRQNSVGITFNSRQAGALDLKTGDFTFLGQD